MKTQPDYHHSTFILSFLKISLPIILLMVATSSRDASASNIDLATLLNNVGNQIDLNPVDTYSLSAEYPLTKGKTVYGHGATLTLGGPISALGGNGSLVLDNVKITSSGWAAVAAKDGAQVYVQNGSEISCVGSGSAIYSGSTVLPSSRASVANSVISGCMYGVNVEQNASAEIHGTSITNTPYAVMVRGGSSSVTIDQQSALSYIGSGTGVSIMGGASATLRDSSVIGFMNGVDIQPSTPGGSAYIYASLFQGNYVSALSTVNASDVLFSGSRVENAKADGIYLQNSKGIIENSEILGSLMTGVTFMGCQNGATIRNSYVRGSVDQGISVVALPGAVPIPSRNVAVLNNTIVDNVLPGLYIDSTSTAFVQGNTFTSSTNFSSSSPAIYLDGTQDILLDSSLITRFHRGMEIKNGSSTPNIVLSNISQNNKNGILVYDNSSLIAEHSLFWNNGLTAGKVTTDSWSIFVNTGATADAHGCTFGPKTTGGLYNNTTRQCYVNSNYWDASDGPHVADWILPAGATNGSGARLESSYSPLGPVTYTPFLTELPVESFVDLNVSLPSGGNLLWGPALGVTLQLTAKQASTALTGEIAGVLRVNDTANLNSMLLVPPSGLVPGQIHVVWVSTPLRLNSASGSLIFRLPPVNGNILLHRRNSDRTWTPISSTWDSMNHVLTYSATDPNLLNGTFALTHEACQQCMRDLITYFYNTVLARDPEAGAVDAWETGYFKYALNLNIDVKFIPAEMGRLFFLSPEYQSRHRTNEDFITDCYRAFLHRYPSPEELTAWGNGVWNRPEAMAQFAISAEFADYVANLFPGFNGLPTRNFVTTMYIGLHDRIVDGGGLLYWTELFDQSTDKIAMAKWMAGIVINSPEFQGSVKTNEALVSRLYRSFLGRFPSDGEIAYWAGELTAGRRTLTQVIDSFASSYEFTQIMNKYFPQ